MTIVRKLLVALGVTTLIGGGIGFAASLNVESQKIAIDGEPVTLREGLTLDVSATGGSVNTDHTATATLTGGTSSATGSITFSLLGPTAADASCSGATVGSESINLTTGADSDTYSSSAFKPTSSGTYWWRAQYSGDTDNDAVEDCASITVGGSTISCGFVLSAPTTATAGAGFAVTLTAQKANAAGSACETDPSYGGSKPITWSGGTTSPAPTNKTVDRPASSVTFSSGVASNVTGWVLYAAGTNSISVAEGAKSGSASVSVAAGLPALAFTETAVKGTSVTCSPTAPIDVQGNKDVLTTKVKVTGFDSWSNSVTLPASGTISVGLAFNATASARFDAPASGSTPLSIVRPADTSGGSFSAARKDGGTFTGGTLTASATGYASATCALHRP